MKPFRPTLLLWLAVACLAVSLGAGCGKSTSGGISAAQSSVFDSAPADVKDTWQKVLAADAATNYLDTLKLLNKLNVMQLTDAQRNVLDKKSTDFMQRLWSAAAKNDPSAQQAVQAMRTRQTLPQ